MQFLFRWVLEPGHVDFSACTSKFCNVFKELNCPKKEYGPITFNEFIFQRFSSEEGFCFQALSSPDSVLQLNIALKPFQEPTFL